MKKNKDDIESGKNFVINGRKKSDKTSNSHYGSIYSVAVSHNGKYVVSGGVDSELKIWDCRTHDLIETFKGHRDTITTLQFHPSNNTLFSGSQDRMLKVNFLIILFKKYKFYFFIPKNNQRFGIWMI